MKDRLRILVIDDDRLLQVVLTRILRELGADVQLASDGQSGLQRALEQPPHLVICDWVMAGMDGLEVCRQFKADPGLKQAFFILLTSRSEVDDRVAGLDAGADDFLSKPLDPSELKARIRSGLRIHQANAQLRQLSADLAQQKHHLEAELARAAGYVRSLLPARLDGAVGGESLFLPSQQLGGDCFDFYWLDHRRLLVYILDVSGHGVTAALTSISVHNLLRSRALPKDLLADPGRLLTYLNACFQMDRQNDQYFTMWCGIYDKDTRELQFASAGHPPALLYIPGVNSELKQLKAPGLPIGLFDEAVYLPQTLILDASSQLFLCTDGIFEIHLIDGRLWEYDEFLMFVKDLLDGGVRAPEQLVANVLAHTANPRFNDDVVLIALEL
ncbi:SpoIIE family protein phosphatase [Synechococcus sp. ATX 2A4]|uniref:PP2C family protein-serine/threonine phosphatase n=1 Tax=Synechococcus sp. ATX 2A4 TaxID=2823727 RepID=UPI0020CE8904|nr:SpoIIE family protein phosphatase [Synechococcus sp. ATX 2A4]MCP9884015.1 SpoIIE family protein phosphatase [Synechococcus sp. ATX 2A4]